MRLTIGPLIHGVRKLTPMQAKRKTARAMRRWNKMRVYSAGKKSLVWRRTRWSVRESVP